MKDVLPINMASSTFSEMKGDLKKALDKCLTEMKKVDSDVGKVTLAISITKDKMPVTTEKDYRDAVVPRFKWKAESNVPMKTAYEGELGGEYELIDGEDGFALKSINGQTSMFDDEDEDEVDEE